MGLPATAFRLHDIDPGKPGRSQPLWGFHPDGQRLLALRNVAPQYKGDRVVAVLNWFDQVRAKAPTR